MIVLLLACAPEEVPPPPDDGLGELPPVDISGIDFAAAGAALLDLALVDVAPRRPWEGHMGALAGRSEGCPDIYVGTPDEELEIPEDRGWSWLDRCGPYAGWTWWDAAVATTTDAGGATTEGWREMSASASVLDDEGQDLWAFRGELEETLTTIEGEGYTRWTWRQSLDGTLIGASLADTAAPGGLRAEQYLDATGGDDQSLELRTNVYLLEDRIAERFDSIAADIELQGPLGASSEDCTLEPRGWIALRDPDAVWYDLVFLPRYDGDVLPEGSDGACDGCATLYVRGEAQPEPVCVDFQGPWSVLEPPESAAFAFSLRDLEGP